MAAPVAHALRLERRPQGAMIVDLAVEGQDIAPASRQHRLMAVGGKVEQRRAGDGRGSTPASASVHSPSSSGPRCRKHAGHARDKGGIGPAIRQHSGYAAHATPSQTRETDRPGGPSHFQAPRDAMRTWSRFVSAARPDGNRGLRTGVETAPRQETRIDGARIGAMLPRMIFPRDPQTAADVGGHYDELDETYRSIWGEHVHHGYWRTGRETSGAGDRESGRPGRRAAGAEAGHDAGRYRLRLWRDRRAARRARRGRGDRLHPFRGAMADRGGATRAR